MPGAGGKAAVDDSVVGRGARLVFLGGEFRISARLGREVARGQGTGSREGDLTCRPGAAGSNGNRGNDEEAREKREGGQRRHDSTMHRNLTQELRQRSGRRHQGSAHARPSSREATNLRTRASSDRQGWESLGRTRPRWEPWVRGVSRWRVYAAGTRDQGNRCMCAPRTEGPSRPRSARGVLVAWTAPAAGLLARRDEERERQDGERPHLQCDPANRVCHEGQFVVGYAGWQASAPRGALNCARPRLRCVHAASRSAVKGGDAVRPRSSSGQLRASVLRWPC